eukprot:TRINITY_DN1313_c0_g1_i1.p1 TRINITY_DN1313_c0_g1~~TRINITY_DN1313_c0_g1_i1.p1  ORF type:complete len:700 (-),score=-83.95 TRINITY_DN1313_c0_g1_i1:146-2245(-)
MASAGMPSQILFVVLLTIACATSEQTAQSESRKIEGTILFATVGRTHYAFDIYTVPLKAALQTDQELSEFPATDGKSVNYNGHFIQGHALRPLRRMLGLNAESVDNMAFVSERTGLAEIYITLSSYEAPTESPEIQRRVAIEGGGWDLTVKFSAIFGTDRNQSIRMEDRPSLAGDSLVYVSTKQPATEARKSWTAIYATSLRTGATRRLTPEGVADLSPAVSPSGEWVAVASAGARGWLGETKDLETDIYVFRLSDSSGRRRIVKHGGWPTWADDNTLYFHRQVDDGWWSIFRAVINERLEVKTQRITPPGLHAFTPSVHRNGRWLAVATRRPGSDYRHVEVFDLETGSFIDVTRRLNAETHHFNPFMGSDRIGYHRCRGDGAVEVPAFEKLTSPLQGISLFRVDGSFPKVSPDGSLVAYTGPSFSGLYVMNSDGTGVRKVFCGTSFATAWGPKSDMVYTSNGQGFAAEDADVDILAVYNVSGGPISHRRLTTTANNAFPSPSPDGRQLVFRSGRSGHKNLYIMDALTGEDGGLWRLTEGPWTDTMPNWSPDGRWIAFSSDREDPGAGGFSGFLVRPDGSGLRRVLKSGEGGRVNHAFFSPDSKSLVFTTDYAGVSVEPVSTPNQFQPYGEIFISAIDGSEMVRLSHNGYEDGTPSWSSFSLPVSGCDPSVKRTARCDFDDERWLVVRSGNVSTLSVKC